MVVIDSFLDKKTLKKLNNFNLWQQYSFDKTNKFYWINKKQKSKNIFESIIIDKIIKKVDKEIISKSIGYEYWINILNKKLDWHLDKDESLLNTSIKNAVYYGYPHKVKGGNLLTDKGHNIEPKYNRLVIFDNTLHAVDDITSGERVALSLNFWYHKPIL